MPGPIETVQEMWQQCLRKAAFKKFKTAQLRASEWNRKEPPGPGLYFHVYRCPLCNFWHVGRTRKKSKRDGQCTPSTD